MVRHFSIHLLFALLSIIFFPAISRPSVDPVPLLSLRAKPNQTASGCSYRVRISTSCSSVSYTRDQISLSFGDAYGNQVYIPRIDDPYSHTFEACSTDTFDINGPCTYDVCYVYVYRRGYDGWMVGRITISGSYTRTVTFNYNSRVPNDVWYGFNYCRGASSHGSRKPQLSTLIMIAVALLFFMLQCVF